MPRRAIQGTKKYRRTSGEADAGKLSQMIEDAIMRESNDVSHKTKKSFSPSTVGYGHGKCPRYWHIAFKGAEFEDKFDPMAVANMDNGSFTHERIAAYIEKAGIQVEREREITSTTPPIRGFIDSVVDMGHGEVPIEVKSIKMEGFQQRVTTMRPPGYHLVQLLIYMKLLGADYGFFYYENKNTQQFVIIPVSMTPRNKKLVDDVFEWMTTVYNTSQDEHLAQRPFPRTSLECKNCPVKKTCWAGDEGTTFIEPLKVPRI